jgi:hypothetical protein
MKITVIWKNPLLRAVLLGIALALVWIFSGDQFKFVYQAY